MQATAKQELQQPKAFFPLSPEAVETDKNTTEALITCQTAKKNKNIFSSAAGSTGSPTNKTETNVCFNHMPLCKCAKWVSVTAYLKGAPLQVNYMLNDEAS